MFLEEGGEVYMGVWSMPIPLLVLFSRLTFFSGVVNYLGLLALAKTTHVAFATAFFPYY